jgi:hypothetical protein
MKICYSSPQSGSFRFHATSGRDQVTSAMLSLQAQREVQSVVSEHPAHVWSVSHVSQIRHYSLPQMAKTTLPHLQINWLVTVYQLSLVIEIGYVILMLTTDENISPGGTEERMRKLILRIPKSIIPHCEHCGDFYVTLTRVEAGSNTSTVTLRVVRGDEMGLKKAAP